MKVRMRVLSLLILLFASLALAGGKKKVLLPTYVLNARSVVVLIDPTAGTSMSAPLANKTAQEDVEKALAKWGAFRWSWTRRPPTWSSPCARVPEESYSRR